MPSRNLLLVALPATVRDRIVKRGRIVELAVGKILHRPGREILHVYFPLNSLISVTVTMSEGRTSEAGIVGSREMVGVNAFMGGRETNQTEYICQSPGSAFKVDAALLLEEFNRNKAVRDLLLRYTQAYIAQLSQNVACNRIHTIQQRMARWLLECRDRLHEDNMSLPHEFIAQMLGVRRAGVSETAAKLQKSGCIVYGRRYIRVLDVSALESAACECFRVIREEYDRLLGARIKGSRNSN